MKFLFVTGSLNQGGAEYQIIALAKLLKDNYCDVLIVALTDHSFYKQFLIENELKYIQFSNEDSKLIRFRKLCKVIKKYSPNYIISYLKIPSQFTLFSKFLSNHDCKFISGDRTSAELGIHDLVYFNLMRFSDHVTVNSLRKLAYINRRFSFLKNKVSFFPNIIDTIKFSPSNSRDSKLELNVCYVGRISPEKNLESLIYAVHSSLLKGYKFKLTIYGDQRNLSYYHKLLSLVNDLKLNQTILFKGKINNVLSIYHEADLICLVSFYEGFSNVISEAMACGVPILASDIIENEYLITHGENGFLANPNSIESISDCLDKFFSLSPNERAKIGINNRAKAIEMFDSKAIFKDYMKLFNSL